MEANAPGGLLRWFDELQDPRPGHNVMHLLSDMLAIAILAVICGADGWVEVEEFGRCKQEWLKTFLRLPHGIPSHDTFGRVFGRVLPEQFERCFLNWTAHLARHKSKLIAIDGKTLRRSFDSAGGKEAIHMISAWCQENRMVLGQLATQAKSNEITAIPKLLKLLDLQGTVVSIDAMGCQKSIAKTIVKAGGDYILQVKENQHTLHESLRLLFAEGLRDDCQGVRYAKASDVDKGHGRIETRTCWTTSDIAGIDPDRQWDGLKSVVCVQSLRETAEGASTQSHYYISSMAAKDAREMLQLVRSHWSIENSLHWTLDVQLREDDSRIRKGHAPENFSRLRRWALNLLKKDQTRKVGIKTKSKCCSWDHDYLLKILTG
ncbi:MAG TPA: ISAs1 family transposase [Burkholderiaceae bacterium]|nr:ISAs1 family transposase [Burkholderiaceae bacterium]